MKNQLKIAFGIALMSVFSVGCKKDSNKPSAEQATFTITSDTFKDGVVDHSLLRKNKINDPHLAWKNPPVGAKGYWIIMEDDKYHVYWNGNFKEKATSWEQNGIDHFSYSSFKLPDHNGTFATIEIFALNCTPTEFKNTIKKKINGGSIYKASRKTIREVLKQKGLSNMILGSAEVKYKVKPQVVAAADKDPSKPTQTAEPAPGVAKETTPNGGASLGEPNQVLVEKAKPIINPTLAFNIGTVTTESAEFIVSNPSGLTVHLEYAEELNNGSYTWTKVPSQKITNNTVKISGLTHSKEYQARLGYTIDGETKYSELAFFQTSVSFVKPAKTATPTLKLMSPVTANKGSFIVSDHDEWTLLRFEYARNGGSEWYDAGLRMGGNVANIFDLNPSTDYLARLVYRKDGQTTYTNEVSFTTAAE